MGDIIEALVKLIASGDEKALYALLILIILALGYWATRLNKQDGKLDDRLLKVVADYQRNLLTVGEALDAFKIVLLEIKNKL